MALGRNSTRADYENPGLAAACSRRNGGCNKEYFYGFDIRTDHVDDVDFKD
jgi:hypothetical protein